jgi:general secretion pathway protein D
MTSKSSLFLLFLATTGMLRAQTPPMPTGVPPATNQAELLKQRLRQPPPRAAAPAAGINPASPGTTPPGNPAGTPVPGTSPDDQTIAISPTHPATAPEEMIAPGMIDFRAVDVNQVLQLYAEWVNRTVLRPATLPAPTITLKSQTPLTRREAIQALDAVLALNGISMINVGDKFVKAVPQTQANQEGAPFSKVPGAQLPDMGQYVTHIVQLKYLKPSEVVPVLQPFAKLPNSILPVETSQILVLRDNAENVKRMIEMIDNIDVVTPAEYTNEVIMIKYALASDIASALNSLSSGGGGATVGSGSRAGGTAGGARSGGFGRGTSGGFGTGSGFGGSSAYPGQTGYGGTGFGGGTVTPQATTTPAAGGSSFTQRLQNIINKASSSGEIQVLGQTKIIADERTNSLLVYASREDMKTIKDIVAKLDVVLAQVLIEAVIVEVTLDNNSSLGVNFLEQTPHGIGNYYSGRGAIINNNTPTLTPQSFDVITNAGGGLVNGFNYLARFGGDLSMTLSALAAGTHAKVLQRPRIQTSHAVPASLFVGQSRPYPTGSYYGGGAYGGYSSIQQLQIGVSMDVTPLINPDGLVVMDIHEKIDNVTGSVNIANVGDVPITSEKEAQAKVAVKDKDTIILGGLIETDKSDSNSGVPFFKDIPLIGFLFRSSTKDETRSELIVLIRPTVLPTPEVAALAATADKRNMPGVRETEQEIQHDEEKLNREADKLMQKRAIEHDQE